MSFVECISMDIEGGVGMEVWLPVDVLMEILSWIPAKSLLRFKSVSKCWYSLIQNPSFISLHHNRAQPNDGLVLVENEWSSLMYLLPDQTSFQEVDFSFTGLNVNEELCLEGSSNGVMCLSNLDSFENPPTHAQILICNPATREFRLLPQPPYHTLRTSMLRFAFHPDTYGSYRVVRVATLFRSDPEPSDPYDDEIELTPVDHKIHVYDVGMDSWREIVATVPRYFFCERNIYGGLTSLGGDFYWMYFDLDSAAFTIGVMRTFQESFEQIPLPNIFSAVFVRNKMGMLCVLKDSLALVFREYDYKLNETLFEIWVMEEYGVEESWTKKYSIGPLLGSPIALRFRPNEEVFLMMNFHGSKLVSYNLSTNDTNEYNQLCDRPGLWEQYVFPYAESLISINILVV